MSGSKCFLHGKICENELGHVLKFLKWGYEPIAANEKNDRRKQRALNCDGCFMVIGEIILLESNSQTSDTDAAENLDRRKTRVLRNLSEGLKCI